jgi:voltage-gated potassium channel
VDVRERRRVFQSAGLAALLFIALLSGGTACFAFVSGEGAEQAFYRSLAAFTTADLVDKPHTSGERAIAAALTVAGGLFYLALLGSIVQAIVVRNALADTIRERRARRRVSELTGHYVVCGYGQVGRAVTAALLERGETVVVVERSIENGADAERAGALLIRGDADDSDVLTRAGVEKAKGLIACVGTDAENVYIALAARRCSDSVFIAARASDEEAAKNLRASGVVHHVSTPYTSAGRALAAAVVERREDAQHR